jgi:hypothetical protein
MNHLIASLIVAACVFLSACIGLMVHRVQPESHRTKETLDVVRLGTGMLSVLASLVLGLLIATAKSSSDATDNDVRGFAAELILLNETLRDYGDAAAKPRDLLRQFTTQTLRDLWSNDGAPQIDNPRTAELLEHVREAIRALKPVDSGQQWLQDQALEINVSLIRQRWQLIERQGSNIRLVVVGMLVFWVAAIFASFGLNAPRNATVVVAFLVCALSIGCAVFVILEMDSPFQGVLRLSKQPLTNALAHMQL